MSRFGALGIFETLGISLHTALTVYSSPQSGDITQLASSPPFLGTLVVKGTRTRYHGQNNRITLLNQVSWSCRSPSDCSTDMPSSPKQKSSLISAPKILPLQDWPKRYSFSKVNPSCRRVRQSQYQIWKVPQSCSSFALISLQRGCVISCWGCTL